jgi:hypothetical protein
MRTPVQLQDVIPIAFRAIAGPLTIVSALAACSTSSNITATQARLAYERDVRRPGDAAVVMRAGVIRLVKVSFRPL